MKAHEAQSGGNADRQRIHKMLAILYGIPIIGNLNSVLSVLAALWPVPAGTSIRPMGLAFWLVLVAAVTAAFGFAAFGFAMAYHWRRPGIALSAALCLLLSFTPWFSGGWILKWVVERHGLVMSK